MKNTFNMLAIAMLISAVVTLVRAESHGIFLINSCDQGTPQLVIGGQVVSDSFSFQTDGPQSGIAYLQTGDCGLNGENCAIVQFTLMDGASDVAISLIPPHALNVPIEYSLGFGCTDINVSCTSTDCPTALHNPGDQAGSNCQGTDIGLLVTFCPGGLQAPVG